MGYNFFMAATPSFVERFFPPPRFLTFGVVGLDISENSIKFLSLRRVRAHKEVTSFGVRALPAGIIKEGDVKDPSELAAELAKLSAQERVSAARVSLPEQKAFLFEAAIPRTVGEDLRTLVEFQLAEQVPLEPGEAEFDFEVRARHENHDDVVVTAYPRRAIGNYLEALRRAGITALSFEIEAQAIARAVAPREGVVMIVDFGETKTGLSVAVGGLVRFMTTLDVAGRSITDAIKKEFDVAPAEVERLKMEEGLSRREKNQRLFGCLVTTISALKDEIAKHFVYWQSHPGKKGEEQAQRIEKIILCGGNANLRGLPEYLSLSLRIPAERGNVWRSVASFEEYVPPITRERSLGYATAVGLALRDFS